MSVEGIYTEHSAPLSEAADVHARKNVSSTFMGHEVEVVDSPESLLSDAAEELGFAVDATDDCEITERKEKESVEVSERLRKLYDVLMHRADKGQRMSRLVDALRAAGNRRAMREALTKEFSDVTDAWVALSAAFETLQKEPEVSQKTIKDIQALAEDFLQENGEQIRLGLQGAVTGADFSAVGVDAGRDLYRETVGDFAGVTEVFSDIQTKFGDSFDEAMDFLFAAISADIASDVPSMGKTHLENVHEKLQLVRLTQSAYRLCEGVIKRCHDELGGRGKLTGMQLLGTVLQWAGLAYLSVRDVTEPLKDAALPDIGSEVLFLQDILTAVRRFPTALFGGDDGQLRVTQAVQSAVDEAVAREDEWLAQQN